MKKITVISIILGCFVSIAHPQKIKSADGGLFIKRVEYNLLALDSLYNLAAKGELEKRFFDKFNGFVEFFHESQCDQCTEVNGFRIIKGKSNKDYVLEVKYLSDFKDKQITTLTFPISARFAEELHKKMAWCIDSFKAEGIPPMIDDGYEIVLRTVVDYEVWSLRFHVPYGNPLKITKLCNQIISDARANKLDESKYLTALKGL